MLHHALIIGEFSSGPARILRIQLGKLSEMRQAGIRGCTGPDPDNPEEPERRLKVSREHTGLVYIRGSFTGSGSTRRAVSKNHPSNKSLLFSEDTPGRTIRPTRTEDRSLHPLKNLCLRRYGPEDGRPSARGTVCRSPSRKRWPGEHPSALPTCPGTRPDPCVAA